eukprot:1557045-Alexandrium_andersonii.AAC.1
MYACAREFAGGRVCACARLRVCVCARARKSGGPASPSDDSFPVGRQAPGRCCGGDSRPVVAAVASGEVTCRFLGDLRPSRLGSSELDKQPRAP